MLAFMSILFVLYFISALGYDLKWASLMRINTISRKKYILFAINNMNAPFKSVYLYDKIWCDWIVPLAAHKHRNWCHFEKNVRFQWFWMEIEFVRILLKFNGNISKRILALIYGTCLWSLLNKMCSFVRRSFFVVVFVFRSSFEMLIWPNFIAASWLECFVKMKIHLRIKISILSENSEKLCTTFISMSNLVWFEFAHEYFKALVLHYILQL